MGKVGVFFKSYLQISLLKFAIRLTLIYKFQNILIKL